MRGLRRGVASVTALIAVAWLLAPASPRDIAPVRQQPVLWRGAYHVHSTMSDGSGTPEDIALAARQAGLDFVIITDHGDGTRQPEPPRFVHDVLLIDGVEISTDNGHYVAFDMAAAPYPLAGAGEAVVEDVRRLGGIGILAHPDSPDPALAWHNPSVDADGYEWLNADTIWRTASMAHVAVRMFTYPFDRAGSLTALAVDPGAVFGMHDRPRARVPIALAAVDAHARVGWRRDEDPRNGGRTIAKFPSYTAMFGTAGLVVPWLDGAPSGDAARDTRVVLHAIRYRVAHSAVFSMARTPWVALDLVEPADTALQGPDARGAATLVVRSNAPADAHIRVRRNGVVIHESLPAEWSSAIAGDEAPAIYRAEMVLPARRGWSSLPVAVSAARGHNLPPTEHVQMPTRLADMAVRAWHVEHDTASTASVETTVTGARAELRLAGGARVSQFSALVADLEQPPAEATSVVLDLSADEPMRLSIQLREPGTGDGLRWRQSAYLDATPRTIVLPLGTFMPVPPAIGGLPLSRIHALLLVTDTVNGRPGDVRRITVHAAKWGMSP